MSSIIGTRNFATQNVITGGIIDLGNVYRRFEDRKRCTTVRPFDFDNTDVILQQSGMYHVTVTAVASGAAAGTLAIQLYENGVAVPGVFANETITTADTELRTLTLDYFVLVDDTTILGYNTTIAKAISVVNTGIEATFTSVVVNVEKVVS